MRGPGPCIVGCSVQGFVWQYPDLFGLARIGFSAQQLCRPSPEEGSTLVFLLPSGSCWLSLQSLSKLGCPLLSPLERLPGVPACVSAPHQSVVSAASSLLPRHTCRSARPALLSSFGCLSLLQGTLDLGSHLMAITRAPPHIPGL